MEKQVSILLFFFIMKDVCFLWWWKETLSWCRMQWHYIHLFIFDSCTFYTQEIPQQMFPIDISKHHQSKFIFFLVRRKGRSEKYYSSGSQKNVINEFHVETLLFMSFLQAQHENIFPQRFLFESLSMLPAINFFILLTPILSEGEANMPFKLFH